MVFMFPSALTAFPSLFVSTPIFFVLSIPSIPRRLRPGWQARDWPIATTSTNGLAAQKFVICETMYLNWSPLVSSYRSAFPHLLPSLPPLLRPHTAQSQPPQPPSAPPPSIFPTPPHHSTPPPPFPPPSPSSFPPSPPPFLDSTHDPPPPLSSNSPLDLDRDPVTSASALPGHAPQP